MQHSRPHSAEFLIIRVGSKIHDLTCKTSLAEKFNTDGMNLRGGLFSNTRRLIQQHVFLLLGSSSLNLLSFLNSQGDARRSQPDSE